MKLALTESVRRKRNRQVNISIQMTILTWSLELITGIVNLVIYFVAGHDGSLQAANIVLALFTHFLHFIIIPSVYNLNTGVVKECILKNGWLRSLRAVVLTHDEHDILNENDETDFVENDHGVHKIPTLPIRAISADPKVISVSKECDMVVVSVE